MNKHYHVKRIRIEELEKTLNELEQEAMILTIFCEGLDGKDVVIVYIIVE